MRGAIVNIIVEYLIAGHSATVLCGRPEKMACVQRKILDALEDLGVKTEELGDGRVSVLCPLSPVASWLQIGQLQHFIGGAIQHSPLLVLQDVDVANTCLLPDARAIACRFPDGKPAIVIEC